MSEAPSVAAATDQANAEQVQKNKWSYQPPLQRFCKPTPPSNLVNTKILLALAQRDAKLNARSAKLDQKQATIVAAQHLLSNQLATLKLVQTRLLSLQTEQNHARDARSHALAQTYEVMQPGDAGAIFDKLNSSLVVDLLRNMDSRHSAAILAKMSITNAQLATEALAGIAPTSVQHRLASSTSPLAPIVP